MFVCVCLRAFHIPFSHDETATFFYYIQSDNYLPYKSHAYTNNHVLNSALSNVSYHIFGSHPFALRLPNVLAFLVLCFGLFKQSKYLKTVGGKLALITLFLLTINFLDFFELCRGYGLSMAFMVLGLAYLLDYFQEKKIKSFIWFSICIQLALSANLTLLIAICFLFLVVLVFQLFNRLFSNAKNIIVLLVNFLMIGFWVKLTLHYKSSGLLDSGSPINYWKTSFVSLIEFIFGSKQLGIQITCILATIFITVVFVLFLRKSKLSVATFVHPFAIYTVSFFAFVIGFWLLNVLLKVNFPEDRTGLFFYLFFALALSFAIERLSSMAGMILGGVISLASLSYFIYIFNLSNFSSYFYHTMPRSVFNYLKEEQAKSKIPFTVGGSTARELNYAFLNHRAGFVVNPMNIEGTLQMNMDYVFALEHEKPYYTPFYEEVAYDKAWNRVLIKRKEPIEHRIIRQQLETILLKGEDEFKNFLQLKDTAFASNNPLEAEIHLRFKDVPKPLNAFLVLSFNDEKKENNDYRRIYLNWVSKDLNGRELVLKLTSGNLPKRLKDVSIYLWNIDKKPINIECTNLKLYQLYGKGVNFRVPDAYYPLISAATQQLQL